MVRDDLIAIAEKAQAAREQCCIQCCMAAGCLSSRSAEIKEVLEKAVTEKDLQAASKSGGLAA